MDDQKLKSLAVVKLHRNINMFVPRLPLQNDATHTQQYENAYKIRNRICVCVHRRWLLGTVCAVALATQRNRLSSVTQELSLIMFTARCYASEVYAVAVCLSARGRSCTKTAKHRIT